MTVTVTDVVAIVGLITGVSGLVLSILNYIRDRAKLDVHLQWDMAVTPGTRYDPTKKWGTVRVSNCGRRATYVSHVSLKLPKGYDHSYLLIMESASGEKLSEGDAPRIYVVSQDGMEIYSNDWDKLFAQVSDSTGKIWKSNKVKEKPSWAV
jgi:hypothetical protein